MKTCTPEELRAILDQHGLWLSSKGGSRADLRGAYLTGADLGGANLSGANLTGANLTGAYLTGADLSRAYLTGADLNGANLTGADLSRANLTRANLTGADLNGADLTGADLTGANLYAWAQVAFKGHGEQGRMLTAYIQAENGPVILQCGCFHGGIDNLKEYIANGDGRHVQSRTFAMETVLKLLKFETTN